VSLSSSYPISNLIRNAKIQRNDFLIFDFQLIRHFKLIPCHSSLARTPLVDGAEIIRIWTVAVNVLNKQLRTGENVSAFTVGLGRCANKMVNNITECLTEPRTWKVFGNHYGRKIRHEN
jgi:hypothetical protein